MQRRTKPSSVSPDTRVPTRLHSCVVRKIHRLVNRENDDETEESVVEHAGGRELLLSRVSSGEDGFGENGVSCQTRRHNFSGFSNADLLIGDHVDVLERALKLSTPRTMEAALIENLLSSYQPGESASW